MPPQVLFALCSLLRHFPYAQQQFLKLGGLQVLRSLVQEKGTEVLAGPGLRYRDKSGESSGVLAGSVLF